MLKLKKFKTLDEIKLFAPQWLGLHKTSVRPDISLSPQWLIAWYKTFGAQSCPQVLAVFENDKPILVAPMHFAAEQFRFVQLEALQSSANGYSPSGGLLVSAELNDAEQRAATIFFAAEYRRRTGSNLQISEARSQSTEIDALWRRQLHYRAGEGDADPYDRSS